MKVDDKIVIDCCVSMMWFTKDQSNKSLYNYSMKIFDLISSSYTAIVPRLWEYEVSNVMSNLIKHKLVTMSQCLEFWDLLQQLDITVVELDQTYGLSSRILLSVEEKISTYDAAYLDLASYLNIQLATTDKKLMQAAKNLQRFFTIS